MLDDLDATLRAMLTDAAAPAVLRSADISFDTPDKDFSPTQATLSVFLHEVAENRGLRDEARIIERTGNTYTSRLPSLRLDCTYLITAWSVQTGGLKTQEEHHLLGLALIWVSGSPSSTTASCRARSRRPFSPTRWPRPWLRPAKGSRWGSSGARSVCPPGPPSRSP